MPNQQRDELPNLKFRQYTTGEWFADLDNKRIARKSIFIARVYPDDSLNSKLYEYPSRIEHCGSCLSEDNMYLDECCCVHVKFHSKKEENEYVKLLGFWKIPFALNNLNSYQKKGRSDG